jgi:hypothetical protein
MQSGPEVLRFNRTPSLAASQSIHEGEVMVVTLTTHDAIAQPAPVQMPGGDSGEQQLELSELGRRPGTCRGVTPHASDWLSCMERRAGSYLPI